MLQSVPYSFLCLSFPSHFLCSSAPQRILSPLARKLVVAVVDMELCIPPRPQRNPENFLVDKFSDKNLCCVIVSVQF